MRLQEQGFAVVEVGGVGYKRDRSRMVRVSSTEVLVFWIQFSIMIDKQVSLVHALDIAAERAESLRFASVLKCIARSGLRRNAPASSHVAVPQRF